MTTVPLTFVRQLPAIEFAAQFIDGHCDAPFTAPDLASNLLMAHINSWAHDPAVMYFTAYELVDRANCLRNNGYRTCHHPDPEALQQSLANVSDPRGKLGTMLAADFQRLLTHQLSMAQLTYNTAIEDSVCAGAFFGSLVFDVQFAHMDAHVLHGGCSRGRLRPTLN